MALEEGKSYVFKQIEHVKDYITKPDNVRIFINYYNWRKGFTITKLVSDGGLGEDGWLLIHESELDLFEEYTGE